MNSTAMETGRESAVSTTRPTTATASAQRATAWPPPCVNRTAVESLSISSHVQKIWGREVHTASWPSSPPENDKTILGADR